MVRVVLVGYGYAGGTFHAPLIRATPGLELVAIASRHEDQVHADFPDMAVIRSAEDACALPSADVVVIATPNDTHVPIATRALRAGKHVVIDKPLAPTLDEARQLLSLARTTDRVLAVFHNRRWDGDFLALKDLLARSALGDVMHFESHFDRYRPDVRHRWREQPGPASGVWYDLGPHLVDQALQLFGLPDRVVASLAAQRPGAETADWAHVVLEYECLRAVLHASLTVAGGSPRFVVHGRLGSWLKYGFDPQERRLIAARRPQDDRADRSERAVYIDGATGWQDETTIPPGDYRRFYLKLRDAVTGSGPNPVPPPQALAVMAVLEAAVHSASEGRALPVPLTDAEAEASGYGG